MTFLWIIFITATVILLAVFALSASQLYKQRGLGRHATTSIAIFTILLALGLLSALINMIAYSVSSL